MPSNAVRALTRSPSCMRWLQTPARALASDDLSASTATGESGKGILRDFNAPPGRGLRRDSSSRWRGDGKSTALLPVHALVAVAVPFMVAAVAREQVRVARRRTERFDKIIELHRLLRVSAH